MAFCAAASNVMIGSPRCGPRHPQRRLDRIFALGLDGGFLAPLDEARDHQRRQAAAQGHGCRQAQQAAAEMTYPCATHQNATIVVAEAS